MERVIYVDLPSAESPRQRQRMDRVRELLGKGVPTKSGRERITISSLAVLTGLAEGLRLAGIDDVVRFEIDGDVIVEDVRDEPGDLPFIVTQAIGAGYLDKEFSRMELLAKDEVAGAELLLHGVVLAEVALGAEELRLSCQVKGRVAAQALDGRVNVIARALAKAFGDVRARITS